jgi:hypothetical protein
MKMWHVFLIAFVAALAAQWCVNHSVPVISTIVQ